MFKQKIYYLLFFFSLIMAVLSFFQSEERMTVNFRDTYYVIEYKHFYIILAFLLAVVFLIYQLLEKMKVILQMSFTLLHVYGTLLSVMAVLYFNYKNAQPNMQILATSDNYNNSFIIALVVVSLVQLFLIMNIFVAIVKKILPIRNR